MDVYNVFMSCVGIIRTRKIKEEKEKHKWAMQIMEKLVESASDWKYDRNGRNPHIPQPHKNDETSISDVNFASSESLDPRNKISLDQKGEGN